MVISFALLLLLFVIGLFAIKFPTNNKFTAWLRGYFSVPERKSEEHKVIMRSTATVSPAAGGKNKNNSEEYKAELKSVFATFDKNNDGFITRQELQESLKNIGIAMTDKDVKEMVEKVDSNGDGLIDIDEFCELFESIMSPANINGIEGEQEEGEDGGGYLKEAFNVFDEDGDGVITVEELGMVLSSLGFKEGKLLESCKEMIRNVDVDGDGKINFDEFKMMMKAGTRFLPVS
ncbi:hypothetical protein DCAR_0415935 [Daucus carota subsp. sativus]|uniref:EF-hand domain-containing protein n=1 Tax=Daucus carota subsp. sativus TaxID=79200 RepID=A0A165WWW0_DAUCS|nr:PREDICTED: calmodulin-like protein 7 [Daucus carota subsp. sativus]WOG96599.1 hypothetical protein DCAR_0415935 [Daucus carota subsp. sativus]